MSSSSPLLPKGAKASGDTKANGTTPPLALDLTAVRARMQQTHDSGVNLTYQWRRQQLLALRRLLNDHWEALLDALYQDLGKEVTEAAASELWIVRNEIDFALRHLRSWMRVRHVPSPAVALPSFQRLEQRPKLGPACLIIGPFNYPVQLTLSPLVGALAAGNPVVLKPSELCPTVAHVLHDVMPLYFQNSVVQVILGGIPETTALLQHAWGLVFFTGSDRVGKIVATTAAVTHTPILLELGGKSPCVVDESAPRDMQLVANRIAWAKWFNAGQVCITVDYLLVHESLVDRLVDALVRTTKWQFGADPRAPTSQWGKMVSKSHAQRLQDMIAEVEVDGDPSCRVVLGSAASCDPAARHVGPTIVLNPPLTSRLLREEIFGPILPILTYRHRSEAVARIRATTTPLCLYVFTTQDKVLREFMAQCRAGAVVQNDVS
jgi:acyl-CoA reductase-like NAD-dependent aldehyde dehydrogenase